jgi:hypothetical protein
MKHLLIQLGKGNKTVQIKYSERYSSFYIYGNISQDHLANGTA